MGDFCWLTGPGLCGKLDFDLPVIEIIVLAFVSGLVTWATIYFSVKSARRETERSLAATKMTSMQAAVLAMAEDAQARFEAKDWRATAGSVASTQAEIILRSSGLPGADDATTWAVRLRQVLVVSAINPTIANSTKHFALTWSYGNQGPQELIVRQLSAWLASPETKVEYFSGQSKEFESTLKYFHNVRQADLDRELDGDEHS